MCIMALQPRQSAVIPDSILRECWKGNHDGAGYMFSHRGELVIRKPFYKLKPLLAAYCIDHAAYGDTSPFVLHFRYATHGGKTTGNTHPHYAQPGLGFAHNGILPVDIPKGSDDSDTVVFGRQYLSHLTIAELLGDAFAKEMGEAIGSFNKLILMDGAGNTSIVNQDAGILDNGIWWSNAGYLPSRYALSSNSDYWKDSYEIPTDPDNMTEEQWIDSRYMLWEKADKEAYPWEYAG